MPEASVAMILWDLELMDLVGARSAAKEMSAYREEGIKGEEE